MVGVISGLALIAGSSPPEGECLDDYELVAQVGNVPVKVRGECRSGDTLTPSGLEDGTAVRYEALACGQSRVVKLGKVMFVEDDGSQDDCKDTFEMTELEGGAGGVEGGRGGQWRKLMTSVLNPAETVHTTKAHLLLRVLGILIAVCILGLAVGLALVASCSRLGVPFWSAECNTVLLPHGVLRGECHGQEGGTCEYVGCDTGYELLSQADAERRVSTSALEASRRADAPGNTTTTMVVAYPVCRHCTGSGSGSRYAEAQRCHGSSLQCHLFTPS